MSLNIDYWSEFRIRNNRKYLKLKQIYFEVKWSKIRKQFSIHRIQPWKMRFFRTQRIKNKQSIISSQNQLEIIEDTCRRSITSLSTAMAPSVFWKNMLSRIVLSMLLTGNNVNNNLLSRTLLLVWWCCLKIFFCLAEVNFI